MDSGLETDLADQGDCCSSNEDDNWSSDNEHHYANDDMPLPNNSVCAEPLINPPAMFGPLDHFVTKGSASK